MSSLTALASAQRNEMKTALLPCEARIVSLCSYGSALSGNRRERCAYSNGWWPKLAISNDFSRPKVSNIGLATNMIEFDVNLVENNRQVRAQRKEISTSLQGNIWNAVTSFFIDSVSSHGSARIKFNADINSVTVESFIDFRSKVERLVEPTVAIQLIWASGSAEHPLEPGRCMNRYVACLFSNMFYHDFNVDRYLTGNYQFNSINCQSQQCDAILDLIDDLKPEILHFEGELRVEGTPGGSNSAKVEIPSIVVDFSEEGGQYRIPFVGYSDSVTLIPNTKEKETVANEIVIEAGKLIKLLR